MRNVVGFSGAQGAGKSTLLVELQAMGYDVDSFKVSRTVQAKLGWSSLSQVLESYPAMISFQEEVFKQKYYNDLALKSSGNGVILVERTFADIHAYTAYWVWCFVSRGSVELQEGLDFLLNFADRCATAQQEIYAGTILLPLMPHIRWEADSQRADETSANQIYEDVERFLERKLPITSRKFTITAATTLDRAHQAQIFLKSI